MNTDSKISKNHKIEIFMHSILKTDPENAND